MGFGSYDESEQQDHDVDTDDSDVENVHEHDHEGEVTFETESSTDELLDRLETIKEDDESE